MAPILCSATFCCDCTLNSYCSHLVGMQYCFISVLTPGPLLFFEVCIGYRALFPFLKVFRDFISQNTTIIRNMHYYFIFIIFPNTHGEDRDILVIS